MSVYLNAIRKVAMLSVKKPDDQSALREIFREYAKTFYTPLHIVEELPLEFVLLHYYENKYSELEEEDLNIHLKHLLSTPEERAKQALEEEAEELKALQELEKEALEQSKKPEFGKLKNQKSLKEPPKEKKDEPEEIQFEESLL